MSSPASSDQGSPLPDEEQRSDVSSSTPFARFSVDRSSGEISSVSMTSPASSLCSSDRSSSPRAGVFLNVYDEFWVTSSEASSGSYRIQDEEQRSDVSSSTPSARLSVDRTIPQAVFLVQPTGADTSGIFVPTRPAMVTRGRRRKSLADRGMSVDEVARELARYSVTDVHNAGKGKHNIFGKVLVALGQKCDAASATALHRYWHANHDGIQQLYRLERDKMQATLPPPSCILTDSRLDLPPEPAGHHERVLHDNTPSDAVSNVDLVNSGNSCLLNVSLQVPKVMESKRRRANWFQFAGLRKILAICVTSLVFYILFSSQEYSVTFDGTVPGVESEAVWQFLADFNIIKKLNPTIEHFSITSDIGDYYNWEYGVYYRKHLSNFPVIKNTAHAHYIVYGLKEPRLKYLIESDQVTCFIGRFFCVDSSSQFICLPEESVTTGQQP